jgi:hypothetical protein
MKENYTISEMRKNLKQIKSLEENTEKYVLKIVA